MATSARESREAAIADIMDREVEAHPELADPKLAEPVEEADWDEEGEEKPAEPAPEPEPAPAAEPEHDKGDLSVALRQEREDARQLRDANAALQARMEQLERLFQQNQRPPEPEQPKEPDDPRPEVRDLNEVGIEEYIKDTQKLQAWKDRQQERESAQLREYVENQKRQQQEMEEQGRFAHALQTHEQRFRQQNDDYDQALQHLARERVSDLTTLEFVDPVRAQNIAFQELTTFARHAMAQGRDPAALMYALAQRRGYARPQPEQPQSNGLAALAEQPSPRQQTAAPAAPSQPPAQPPPRQSRQASAAAQAEAALSGASGTPTSGNSLQAILDADEDELKQMDYMRILQKGA